MQQYTNLDAERIARLPHTVLIETIQIGPSKWVHQTSTCGCPWL